MTLLVGPVALFFLGMGVSAIRDPCRVVAYFGTRELTVDGRNEVRAVYGGFGIAIGLLLSGAPYLPELRDGVLVSVAITLLGMAGGRLVSRAIDGRAGFYPRLFFGIEAGLAGALLAAVRLGA